MLAPSLTIILTIAFASIFVTGAEEDNPVVKLSDGEYQGITNNTSGLSYFLGMRYAAAPLGHLRLNTPHPSPSFEGVHDASRYGAACIQQTLTNVTVPGLGSLVELGPAPPSNQSARLCNTCFTGLFVNVIKPRTIPANIKLPVVFWIYGGGFEIGDTAQNDGTPIVSRSIELGEPVIYVSANYRLHAYGFSASNELHAAGAGNLGLRDQRHALEWVQENIHLFGGVGGVSAGAISIGFHLVINDGNPAGLFRGAFMNSGSPLPSAGIAAGQRYYDALVNGTGCANSTDTLGCLREIPAETITNVVNNKIPNIFSFQGFQIPYLPLVDGDFVKKNPWDSIAEGAYAKIPFVTGDCHDEGTLFALSQFKISTSAEALDYVHRNFFSRASAAEIEEIGQLYPDDPSLGSPFGTGNASNLYPQFKRLSAIEGDIGFQGPRRTLLAAASKTQSVWVYDYRRSDALAPLVGVHHGCDGASFGYLGTTPDSQGIDAVINFVNHLSPVPQHQNSSLSSIQWPMWGSNDSHPALTFWDPFVLNVTSDTEREDSILGLTKLMRKFPLGFSELPISP